MSHPGIDGGELSYATSGAPNDGVAKATAFTAKFKTAVALKYSSLYIFGPVDFADESFNLRLAVYRLTHWRVFEAVVVVLIFANCIFLALDDPTTATPYYLRVAEYFFTACFALELILKVFSQGFVMHPGSYLRSSWNRLDAVIVLFSFMSFFDAFGNYTAMRALRVLRPLRSINGVRGLRNIVNGLLHSLMHLVNVLALAAFLFAIFGILGVQLWQGKLRNRCQLIDTTHQCFAHPSPPGSPKSNTTILCCTRGRSCCTLGEGGWRGAPALDGWNLSANPMCVGLPLDNSCNCTVPGQVTNPDHVLWDSYCAMNPLAAGLAGRSCPAGYECADTGRNPNYGFTSFDNLAWAILVIFQTLTMEGWVDIMYIIEDVHTVFGCFYFVPLVILGSYFVLNLALAVINEEFETIRISAQEEQEQEELARAEEQDEAMIQLIMDAIQEAEDEEAAAAAEEEDEEDATPGETDDDTDGGNSADSGSDRPADRVSSSASHPRVDSPAEQVVAPPAVPVRRERSKERRKPSTDTASRKLSSDSVARKLSTDTVESGAVGERGSTPLLKKKKDKKRRARKPKKGVAAPAATTRVDRFRDARDNSGPQERSLGDCLVAAWQWLRWRSWEVVSKPLFVQIIIHVIFINTVLLAIEHHGQPDSLTQFLDISNVVLTMVFTGEMLLKLMASGFRGYLEDRFNILDGSVVLVSLVEFALSGNSSVSVFRALRLLRVFKLLKNFPELRYLVVVILQAVSDTGYLNLIILLYLFSTALLGMQLFGGKFEFEEDCADGLLGKCWAEQCKDGFGPCDAGVPRSTFDNFYWSMITVFQVLTRDDWVNVMWNAMRAQHWVAALYFIALVICGDFLILNLFLAILIQSFDQNMKDQDDEDDISDEEAAPPPPPPNADEGGATPAMAGRRSVTESQLGMLLPVSKTPAVISVENRTTPRASGVGSSKRDSVVRTEAFRQGSCINIQTTLVARSGGHRKLSVLTTQLDDGASAADRLALELAGASPQPHQQLWSPTSPEAAAARLAQQRSSIASLLGSERNRLSFRQPRGRPGGARVKAGEDFVGSPRVQAALSRASLALGPDAPPLLQHRSVLQQRQAGKRRLSALEICCGVSATANAVRRMSTEGLERCNSQRQMLSGKFDVPRLNVGDEETPPAPPSAPRLSLVPSSPPQAATSPLQRPPPVKGFCTATDTLSPRADAGIERILSCTVSHAGSKSSGGDREGGMGLLNPFAAGTSAHSRTSGEHLGGSVRVSSIEPDWEGAGAYYSRPDELCTRCGELILHPLSTQDSALGGEALHRKVCSATRLRQIRQRQVYRLLREGRANVAAGKPWTPARVEQFLSQAWQVGVFLDLTPAQLEVVERTLEARPNAELGIQWDDKLRLTHVEPNTPASRRGLRCGQQVSSIQGQPVTTAAQAQELLDRLLEDGPVTITVVSTRDWGDLVDACELQLSLLGMQSGEELCGHGAVAVASACRPTVFQTNGGTSLFIFGPQNLIRVTIYRLLKHPWFDHFILACILLSSMLMVVENPRDDNEGTAWGDFLFYSNLTFTAIFVVEMLLKLVAFGMFFGDTDPDPPYARDWWNVLDAMVVAISVVALALSGSADIGFLKVLRAFRALRPLRVVSRRRGLRMVVITLLRSMASIGYVALVSVLVFLVFGILGVQLFAGKSHQCTDPVVTWRDSCEGKWLRCGDGDGGRCQWTRRQWVHGGNRVRVGNFDNIIFSFLTLFEVSTMELWSTIMFGAIDTVNNQHAPRRDERPWIAIYFIVFIVVGAFFILNLFVGFVIFNFNTVKEEQDKFGVGGYVTQEQQLWIETQRMMLNFSPVVRMQQGESRRAKRMHAFAKSNEFELFIGACIALNVVVMGMEFHGMSTEWEFALDRVNDAFAAVFFVEAVIKIAAFGSSYFKDGWNKFDFSLVLLSLFQVFLIFFKSLGTLPIKSNILRVFRIFRIMRILRLVKSAKEVRVLLETVWYSLPQIANIGAFLLLLFFIYAVLGMNLYAKVKRGEYLTHHANFETFWRASLLLMRVVTGENWNGVMHETMVQEPECNVPINGTKPDDCGNFFAPFYFMTFILLATFILTNLFVAIILDNFKTTILMEKGELRMKDLHRFIDIWSEFDPDATLRMPTAKFRHLLVRLGPPLGIRNAGSRVDILKRTKLYCIPEHAGQIHFIETLIPLARQVMVGAHSDYNPDYNELRTHEAQWRQYFPDINQLPVLRFRQMRCTVDQYFSSTYIAAAYRRSCAVRLTKQRREERRAARERWLALGECEEGASVLASRSTCASETGARHLSDPQQDPDRRPSAAPVAASVLASAPLADFQRVEPAQGPTPEPCAPDDTELTEAS
eukprot:TRINITY_DN1582_c0_g3_i1.p1 TRINITY_DN1582_c0_g3~~TRINITY_DN1582_c0_g3_i1.p1  ORF type:complete len:2340 (+),score=847.86 TRINITY_DN1582_c0_g3_i1:111-7130(+)